MWWQTALLMAPLHCLGKNDQNEVQYDFFGHVTPMTMASTSHFADGIVSLTITLLMFR